MKSWSIVRSPFGVVLLCLLSADVANAAPNKPIRLRNHLGGETMIPKSERCSVFGCR
ncbi:MAG: hypothetical protein MUF81_04510 [Verrucomicrobia bacterium]|nr:hypothetical protein [Verrucomicrobiota bacterium]